MRKDTLRFILKELKKKNEITIIFEPTLEECIFLNSKGVSVTSKNVFINGIFSDGGFVQRFYNFSLES